VVLRKSYGNQTYAGMGAENAPQPMKRRKSRAPQPTSRILAVPRPVRDDDLYDLASLTKLMASTPALLRLQTEGKFSPDSAMGNYFPFLRGTDKAGLKMRDVLAHQARLKAWIPFWKELTKKNGALRRRYFRADSSARFPLMAAQNLWARKDLPARIYKEIGGSHRAHRS